MNTTIERTAGAGLAAENCSACLWMCSEISRSDDGLPKPDNDADASKVTAKNPITADTAAEIAVETSDREMSDGDELAVWVWQPGDAANAKEYSVRVSWSWNVSARLKPELSEGGTLMLRLQQRRNPGILCSDLLPVSINNMKTKNVIEVSEWDAVVVKTYGRPYKLQQQDGCMTRGTIDIKVPAESEDYERESVPEEVNHETMGVSFAAWLARDPKQKLSGPKAQTDCSLELWWQRNFYPDLSMVANDLHAKGLLEAGNHTILIDW